VGEAPGGFGGGVGGGGGGCCPLRRVRFVLVCVMLCDTIVEQENITPSKYTVLIDWLVGQDY